MAIKAKIKNPPDKKEPPKREPIVVSDINDSRLKAYRDSLRAFAADKVWENFLKTIPNEKYTIDEIRKLAEKYRVPTIKSGAFDLGVAKNGIVQEDYKRTIYPKGRKESQSYWSALVKEPVQPVIFKAKEKIEKIEPTSKKITFEKSEVAPKKEPSKIKDKELLYKVEYFDPETRKMTSKVFASEKEGSMFQKGLSSVNQLYGTRGYYVKPPNK